MKSTSQGLVSHGQEKVVKVLVEAMGPKEVGVGEQFRLSVFAHEAVEVFNDADRVLEAEPHVS
jgi:hypothetical protein